MSADGFAEFKALCASLDIQTYAYKDTFGRTSIAVDREGLNRLIESGLLPEDPSDLPTWAEILRKRQEGS